MFRFMWRQKWKFLAGWTIWLFVALPAANHYLIENKLRPPLEQRFQQTAAYYPKVLQDLKLLEANVPFPAQPRTKNAEPTLSLFIRTSGGRTEGPAAIYSAALSALQSKFPGWRRDPAQAQKMVESADFRRLDTAWMEELHEFDHWDLTTSPAIQAALSKVPQENAINRIGLFSAMPLPEFIELRDWTEMHFFKMQAAGRPRDGLRTMRKVAQLAHSAGLLIGNMIAVTLLKTERGYAEALDLKDWPSVSEETAEAYRRVSWAWPGLVGVTWFHELPLQFAAYMKPEFGVCAGAWESHGGLSAMQDFLEPRLPFETDFSLQLQRSRATEKKLQEICGLQAYAVFMSPTPVAANPIFTKGPLGERRPASENLSDKLPVNISRIPYVRRSVALALMGAVYPNWFSLYDQQEEK